MKKILLLFVTIFLAFILNAQLVSYQKINSYTVSELEILIENIGFGGFVEPQYGIDVYRVMHDTEYKNATTVISGIVAVPRNTVCKVPLFAYQHGTSSYKMNVPSFDGAEKNIVILFASLGNVVCASDYIGLGASTVNLHPYMHAYSQARILL